MELEIVNPNAAGIDVGSRSHFVAVGQGSNHVKEFGVYAEDHLALIQWLKENEVKTIAMESTGTYWQNLFFALQNADFEVLLANGKFTKNIKGKKTDVLDCQWIQKLHTLGLLSGSFLPDDTTLQLRTYTRHRANLIDLTSSISNKMSKYLRLMNLRLDVVVNDICGLTGLTIIHEICNGETDPQKLAALRHGNCRKSEQEIAKALQSNGRTDLLFALKQEFEMYNETILKIQKCDEQMNQFLNKYFDQNQELNKLETTSKKHKRENKNSPKSFDINQVAYKYFGGVDLMQIEGVSHSTVMTIISEIGLEGFSKFNTSKQFIRL